MNCEEMLKTIAEAKLLHHEELQKNPGYLIQLAEYIFNHLDQELNESEDLEKLGDFSQMLGKLWIQNLDRWPKTLSPDVLRRARGLLAGTGATSLSVSLKPKLIEYVKQFENMDTLFTKEALASCVSMIHTSMSSTTASTPATEAVDAHSSRKRKLSPEFDLEEVFCDQPCSQSSPYPTGNISSFISQRREGEEDFMRYEFTEEWKKYRLQLRLYRTSELREVPKKEHWKFAGHWMDLNFGENSKLHRSVKRVLEDGAALIKEKGPAVKRFSRKY